jgi:hypothetical protein
MGGRSARADTATMHLRLLLAAATACAALALPSVAAAEDYCVGSPAGCTGTAVADPWLHVALHVAQSNGTDDRVFLAPGVFESNSFNHQSGERVQIIGAGPGKTILRGDSDQVLTLAGNQDSSVSGVTVEAARRHVGRPWPSFTGQAIGAYDGAATVTDSTVGAGSGMAASEAMVRRTSRG